MSKAKEEYVSVVFQGVAGAHSHMSLSIFAEQYNLPILPLPQEGFFDDVFKTIISKTGVGWLPIENSYAGSINQTIDFLRSNNVSVVAGFDHPVSHCLAAISGTHKNDVQKVFSHPQALLQCQKYLDTHNYQPEAYNDTAAAARFIRDKKDSSLACLCSALAVKEYGLEMLQESVQDNQGNTTRFLLVKVNGKSDVCSSWKLPTPEKTIIIFETLGGCSALYDVLGLFKKYHISISKISSRPTSKEAFSYFFYSEVEAVSSKNPYLTKLIEELDRVTQSYKIVGEY